MRKVVRKCCGAELGLGGWGWEFLGSYDLVLSLIVFWVQSSLVGTTKMIPQAAQFGQKKKKKIWGCVLRIQPPKWEKVPMRWSNDLRHLHDLRGFGLVMPLLSIIHIENQDDTTALKIWLSAVLEVHIIDPVTHAPGHSKLWVALPPGA